MMDRQFSGWETPQDEQDLLDSESRLLPAMNPQKNSCQLKNKMNPQPTSPREFLGRTSARFHNKLKQQQIGEQQEEEVRLNIESISEQLIRQIQEYRSKRFQKIHAPQETDLMRLTMESKSFPLKAVSKPFSQYNLSFSELDTKKNAIIQERDEAEEEDEHGQSSQGDLFQNEIKNKDYIEIQQYDIEKVKQNSDCSESNGSQSKNKIKQDKLDWNMIEEVTQTYVDRIALNFIDPDEQLNKITQCLKQIQESTDTQEILGLKSRIWHYFAIYRERKERRMWDKKQDDKIREEYQSFETIYRQKLSNLTKNKRCKTKGDSNGVRFHRICDVEDQLRMQAKKKQKILEEREKKFQIQGQSKQIITKNVKQNDKNLASCQATKELLQIEKEMEKKLRECLKGKYFEFSLNQSLKNANKKESQMTAVLSSQIAKQQQVKCGVMRYK